MPEMEIVLTLTARAPQSEAELEQRMFDVLAAVEQHGPDEVLGPVVAVNFDERTIELAFSAETDTISAAQALVSRVIAVIEQHSDLGIAGAGTCAREPEHEHTDELQLVS